jgi:tetratricopeptide (TPR) repeat protein
MSLAGLGRADEALAAYERAIELSPDDVSLLAGRAHLLHRFGRLDEAVRAHRQMAASPRAGGANLAAAYDNIGHIERLRGRYEAAAASYERAFAAGGVGYALASLAGLLVERGDAASALDAYERARAAPSTSASFATAQAWLRFDLGRDLADAADSAALPATLESASLRAFSLHAAGQAREAASVIAAEKTRCLRGWILRDLLVSVVSAEMAPEESKARLDLLCGLPLEPEAIHAAIAARLGASAVAPPSTYCNACTERECGRSALLALLVASMIAGPGDERMTLARARALLAEIARVGHALPRRRDWAVRWSARVAGVTARDARAAELLDSALRALEGYTMESAFAAAIGRYAATARR